MAIEWAHIGQPAFDRVVEGLAYRLYSSVGTVRAVNGRGGDKGIDIEVKIDDRLRIYQLKYYPDGFPTSAKGRRTSIKKSFHRAVSLAPDEWVLVVPTTLSNGESEFVESLAEGTAVEVSIMDRAALDSAMAAHPDYEGWVLRNVLSELREAARDLQAEQAILAGGLADLTARYTALGQRVDSLDDHWTIDVARHDGMLVHTLRGQHPQAHEVSPITVELTGRAPWNPELLSAVERSLGFGVPEQVTLPSSAVESLVVSGPEWLSGTHRNVQVTWIPLPSPVPVGTTFEIAFVGDDGNPRESFLGRVTHTGSGHLGWSCTASFFGGAELLVEAPRRRGEEGRLALSFDLEGLEATDALRIVRLQQRLTEGGATELRVNGTKVSTGELPSGTPQEAQKMRPLLDYVEDLELVQRHCGLHFPVPYNVTRLDRLCLRMARLLVEGHCIVSPFHKRLTLTLADIDPATVRARIEAEAALVCVTRPFEIPFASRSLPMGDASVFHTQVRAEDPQAVLQALDTGITEGLQIAIAPVNGEKFRIFLPALVPPDRVLTTTPFALPTFAEPR